MINVGGRDKMTIISTYNRMFRFNLFIHFLVFMSLCQNDSHSFSVLISVKQNEHLSSNIIVRNYRKVLLQGKSGKANIFFTFWMILSLLYIVSATWLAFLLLLAGDVHPNPGPSRSSSVSSDSSTPTSMSNSLFNSLNLSHSLSFVHYNVQSILTKLDTLYAELYEFDILAFTETWLSPAVDPTDLLLESYCEPERKDRPGDSHGGIMIYIKEGIFYKRRKDLEPRNIECIWLEIANCNRRLLFGLFYRPPSSDAEYLTYIENSIALAIDTNISDIIVTGDFNFDLLNERTSRKIESICTQYSLFQVINQPTNFTEHSATLIDILLVNNKHHLILSGVGDPFLNQELRYHCPIYGILKFSKNKIHSFTRKIWRYDQGNYELLRNKAAAINWGDLRDNDIDSYAAHLNYTITNMASECIPNKIVKIKPAEPSWINANIKQYIRKRKRAYRKARRTNTDFNWRKFKTLRNKTVALIRDAKRDSKLYRQIVGIPMGTNCAPLVADLFLFCYERDFMLSLSEENQSGIIEAFNSTSRYLDDLLNIDNNFFDSMVNRIYPSELQLNKANVSDAEASFLDLHLSISDGFVKTKIYDKRDDFDFDIVNFPFLDGDVPRSASYGVYISQLIRFARVSSHVDDFNTRNKVLTAKLLRQGYRYHKLRKAFSKFYRRHFDIVSKYNVVLKTLLLQGLSEPEFYGDLVYKFRKIIGKIDFPYHFKKIIVRYKKIGYNINVMRQTACLVVNPIKVNSFAYLFNCTTVGRTSD